MIVSVGLPLHFHGALFNTAALLVDGELMGLAAKQNLAGEGLHYEPRWFKPWPSRSETTVTLPWGEYPFGDVIFDCGGARIGFEICEDAWVAGRPGVELAQQGRRHPAES